MSSRWLITWLCALSCIAAFGLANASGVNGIVSAVATFDSTPASLTINGLLCREPQVLLGDEAGTFNLLEVISASETTVVAALPDIVPRSARLLVNCPMSPGSIVFRTMALDVAIGAVVAKWF